MNKDNEYKNFTLNLGLKLRMMRDYLNINISDASNRFKLSNGNITSYESGKETPNLLYLSRITRACGLKLDDLMLERDEFVKKLYFS